MAFVNQPVEEPEKSLRDYASPLCEDIKVQESDSKLEATEYLNKSKIIEMVAANPFEGMVTENPYRHIRNFTISLQFDSRLVSLAFSFVQSRSHS
jgi:hypothetical protein